MKVFLISACLVLIPSLALSTSDPFAALRDNDFRRSELKKYAVSQFRSSSNHCRSFAKISAKAAKDISDMGWKVDALLEDLRLVIIGEDTFLRRGGKRGKHYMGIATNDSGFKSELKDGSPQVEHAMAGMYFAKGLFSMPGSVGAQGAFIELLQSAYKLQKPSSADMLLYGYASDIGSRLSNANMAQIEIPITRTLCE